MVYVACVEAEEMKLREASLAASSRFKRVLLHEKEAKESLQKDLTAAQVRESSRNAEDCGVAQKEPLVFRIFHLVYVSQCGQGILFLHDTNDF